MAGFDQNDEATDYRWGYRADALRTSGGVVSYNGFVFPPALSSGVTVVPEYDDSGRTVKYLTVALSIQFILTDAQVDPADLEDLSPISSQFISSMLARLTQPCQQLQFTAQGFGNFSVNAVSGGGIGMAFQDIDFGPKPQVLEWEPLGGGNAARVEWLCTTRIPACPSALGELIQFNYSISWGIDNAGFVFRTVEGFAELPATRSTTGGTQASDFIGTNFNGFNKVRTKLLNAFPFLHNYKRQFFFRTRNNRKFIDFKIEDVEIRSDGEIPPGASEIELNQNITSSLEDGAFYKWKITYSGRIDAIRLPASQGGVSAGKQLAWVWIGKLITQKRQQFEDVIRSNFNRLNTTDKNAILDILDLPNDSTNKDIVNSQNATALIYPIYVSITDSLYSNILLFTVSYIGIMTTSLLGRAVGLFDRVNIPGLNKDDWIKAIVDGDVTTVSINSQYPKEEMVVDLCHPISAPRAPVNPPNPRDTLNRTGDRILSMEVPDEGQDWTNYQNDIIYYDEAGTVVNSTLSPGDLPTQDELPPVQNNVIPTEQDNAPFLRSHGITENDLSRDVVKVYRASYGISKVRMVGKASRFAGKINAPKLLGVGPGVVYNKSTGEVSINPSNAGGAIAHRLGTSKVLHQTKKTGLTRDGSPVVQHECQWDLWYVLDRTPTNGKVSTTGIPNRFQ